MLSSLRIQNLVIVESLEIQFGLGLNVLTGETGAGKSIILKSLELLSGEKGGVDLIRAGSSALEIEALFELSPELVKELSSNFEELSDLVRDGELVLRRILDRSGRGKIYLNGKLITRGLLQNIAPLLIELTSQHEQQLLFDPAEHRSMLDSYCVPDELLDSVHSAYYKLTTLRKTASELAKESSSKNERLRRLSFEQEELAKCAPRAGERAELLVELARLSHSEQIAGSVSGAVDGLDTEVLATLGRIKSALEQVVKYDASLTSQLSLLESARVELEELSANLGNYGEQLTIEPARLEEVRDRVAEIARIERKYGKSESELEVYLKEITGELESFAAGEFNPEKLDAEIKLAESALGELEIKLSSLRRDGAAKLSKAIERELKSLEMKAAKFVVDIKPTESTAVGADSVEFMLSANTGEPPRALGKVASGGELSRVLLVLKTILRAKVAPVLQVFDEVDAGIGGAVSQVVGEKLREISKASQVVVVTHAPQIAALAENHFLVAKEAKAGATRTSVSQLASSERVGEIARMLAGKKVTANFEESARELLQGT